MIIVRVRYGDKGLIYPDRAKRATFVDLVTTLEHHVSTPQYKWGQQYRYNTGTRSSTTKAIISLIFKSCNWRGAPYSIGMVMR